MSNNHPHPWWLPLLLGFFLIGLGVLVAGIWLGIIPAARGMHFAPPLVLAAIAGGLILGGILTSLPQESPAFIRSLLGFVVVILVAIVCNWSAFAPDVTYSSQVSIGPLSISGDGLLGGRIVFGLVAIAVDAFLGWMVFDGIRRIIRRQ